MRYLTLLLFPLLAFACAEKEIYLIAEADDDFVMGSFAGEPFRMASTNQGEATTFYVLDKDDRPILPYAFTDTPDYYPETGLYVGRTSPEAVDIVELVIENDRLHGMDFPTRIEDAMLVKSVLASLSTSCPHPDIATSVVKQVTVTVKSWTGGMLIGSFEAPGDAATAGTFSIYVERPEL